MCLFFVRCLLFLFFVLFVFICLFVVVCSLFLYNLDGLVFCQPEAGTCIVLVRSGNLYRLGPKREPVSERVAWGLCSVSVFFGENHVGPTKGGGGPSPMQHRSKNPLGKPSERITQGQYYCFFIDTINKQNKGSHSQRINKQSNMRNNRQNKKTNGLTNNKQNNKQNNGWPWLGHSEI